MLTTENAPSLGPLLLRAPLSDSSAGQLENKCVNLLGEINRAAIPGGWEPSPAEARQQNMREALLNTPGLLRKFRRSFLVAGRLNFPDRPTPIHHYLEWNDDLSGQKSVGQLTLLRQLVKLYGHRPFELDELDDSLVGQPTAYNFPRLVGEALLKLARSPLGRMPGMKSERRYLTTIQIKFLHNLILYGQRLSKNKESYHVTEAQIRYLYYRGQIGQLIGSSFDTVMEIGGGYGGLAGELLRRSNIRQYLLVELPDAMPLAYFYLKASFDCPIQVLYQPGETVDPDARIVILAPWKLADVSDGIDLLVNTMSFQHMTEENIKYYFAEVGRLAPEWMYLVNRELPSENSYVRISDYPIPDSYATVHHEPWLFSHHREVVLKRE